MAKIYRVLGKKGRITIPFELRQSVGFKYNDILSFTESDDGSSIIVKREKVCDNCNLTNSSQIDKMTLFDFLNQLPVEQQKAALVHLSVKWAMEQAGVNLEN